MKIIFKSKVPEPVPEPVEGREGPSSKPKYQQPNAPVSTGSTSAEPKVPEPVEGPSSKPTYQQPNAPVSTGSTSAEPKVPEPVEGPSSKPTYLQSNAPVSTGSTSAEPKVPEPAVAEQGRSIEGPSQNLSFHRLWLQIQYSGLRRMVCSNSSV